MKEKKKIISGKNLREKRYLDSQKRENRGETLPEENYLAKNIFKNIIWPRTFHN